MFNLQSGTKFLGHSKSYDTLFLSFFFLFAKFSFTYWFSHGQHQVASDWLIWVIPLNGKKEGEKHPPFSCCRQANSTKYGVAYGLRPLGRLSLLTVRCVFYVTWCRFFHTALLNRGRVPARAPTADHTEMLCVWLPLLRVVLGNVPNAHLLGSLCPGGRASWLSLAAPSPPNPSHSPRTMGSFDTV